MFRVRSFSAPSAVNYPFKYSIILSYPCATHCPFPLGFFPSSPFLLSSPQSQAFSPSNWWYLTGCLQANLSPTCHVWRNFLEQLTGHIVLLLLSLRVLASRQPPIQVQIFAPDFQVFLQPPSLPKPISPLFSPNSSSTGKISLILQDLRASVTSSLKSSSSPTSRCFPLDLPRPSSLVQSTQTAIYFSWLLTWTLSSLKSGLILFILYSNVQQSVAAQ